MRLKRPELEDKESVLEMIAEFLAHDSQTAGLWNFQTGETDYEDWLETNLLQEQGFLGLPAIQFVAFADDGTALGFLSLRLRLNDNLLQKGGHIGYSVRPSQRGKGYATAMLKVGLDLAQSKNISRVLVTCSSQNPASRQVILKNGGRLEDIDGDIERYWINLEVADE